MTIKLLSAAFLILFVACNSGQDTKTFPESTITEDTTKKVNQPAVQAGDDNKQTDISNILGIWTDGSSENATFEIRKDSIFYVDQFATYKYSLSVDSIMIFYPDWTFTGAVSFTKDTLVIASEDGTTKYWKFKE